MPVYSTSSLSRLYTCDDRIVLVCEKVVESWDNTVLYGFRDETVQNRLYETGKSQVMFPKSKHNKYKALAVDLAPYGVWGKDRPNIVWPDRKSGTFIKDLAAWYYFAGFVLGVAKGLGIKMRHGGDWNCNRQINDQTFDDLGHFELLD